MECILTAVLRRINSKREVNYEIVSRYLRRFHKMKIDEAVYEKRMKDIQTKDSN